MLRFGRVRALWALLEPLSPFALRSCNFQFDDGDGSCIARYYSVFLSVTCVCLPSFQPASLVELRRWTSTEALGDMTVHPDCTVRIAGRDTDDVDAEVSFDASEYLGVDSTVRPGDDQADHQLPTTEEQVKAIADR